MGPQKNVAQGVQAFWESVQSGELASDADEMNLHWASRAVAAAVQTYVYDKMVGAYNSCPLVVSMSDQNKLKIVRDGVEKTHLPFWGKFVDQANAKGLCRGLSRSCGRDLQALG